MLKSILGRKKKSEDDKKLTVEDLITLERYEEAEQTLRQRLKTVPKDLHAHLKLAEVFVALKDVSKALDEYTFVADTYADDGFYDKAIALLSKATKISPADDVLPRRIERYKRMKRMEARRRLAIEGLLENESALQGKSKGNTSLQVELLWNKIAKSHLVEALEGEKLKRLFSVMEMEQLEEGHEIAGRGSEIPLMYLIVDGVIEATATIHGKEMSIRSFSIGDLVGDSALLERKPWPARYVVSQTATVFKLDRGGLERSLQGNDDPVGYFSVLRRQQHDRDVAQSIQKLSA